MKDRSEVMTKKDLILLVCEDTMSLPKDTSEAAVHLFFEMIGFYLKSHHRVELRGFGSFSLRKRGAHKAHNPRNGKAVFVPEKWTPFFRASSFVKDVLKKEGMLPKKVHRKSGFFSTDEHKRTSSVRSE